MVDNLTPEERRRNMSRIKSRDTTPEKRVRSLLHKMGFRFRLHSTKLPGKPDIVLPKYKTVVFVHGCFWHRHPGCPRASLPHTRREWWRAKLTKNQERDRAVREALVGAGWNVVVVWQCELRDMDALAARLFREITCGGNVRYRTSPADVSPLMVADKLPNHYSTPKRIGTVLDHDGPR